MTKQQICSKSVQDFKEMEAFASDLLWTGSDYIRAFAATPDGGSLLPKREESVLIIVELSAAGVYKRQMNIDPGEADLHPNLAMVDSRPAVAGVRGVGFNTEERYLSFLTCKQAP